jgi:hypothetical protein
MGFNKRKEKKNELKIYTLYKKKENGKNTII